MLLELSLAPLRLLPTFATRLFLQALEGLDLDSPRQPAYASFVFLMATSILVSLLQAQVLYSWKVRVQGRIRVQMGALLYEKTVKVTA